jgi:DNA-binding MarR family transcriptional regulator
MSGERDSVDDILDGWAAERPDLDVRPVGIVTRLARLRGYLDAELVAVFERYGLTPADFQVIVTLRRAGRPFQLPQARLMAQLALTSGTVSVRVDRLVKRGIVVRERDDNDARVTLIGLSDQGHRLFDEIAPVHLRNEDRLLSATTTNATTSRTSCVGYSRLSNATPCTRRCGSAWHSSPLLAPWPAASPWA